MDGSNYNNQHLSNNGDENNFNEVKSDVFICSFIVILCATWMRYKWRWKFCFRLGIDWFEWLFWTMKMKVCCISTFHVLLNQFYICESFLCSCKLQVCVHGDMNVVWRILRNVTFLYVWNVTFIDGVNVTFLDCINVTFVAWINVTFLYGINVTFLDNVETALKYYLCFDIMLYR